MQSNINLAEFRNRLKNNTKIGHPKLKLSPFAMFLMFGDSSKIFYGLFDDHSFSLTSNFRTSPTYFILRGSYKTQNGKLKIKYDIAPRYKYQIYWWIFVPILGFIVFNYLLLSGKNKPDSEVPIIVNLFLMFMVIYGYLSITWKRKKLEKNFIEIFEIKK